MKLGILVTGKPPGDLAERFGDYPDMFQRLLGDGFEYQAYDVQAGELPDHPEAADAYLITGSPAGVYEALPWITPLKTFLGEAKGKSKLVGICFGHQVMAEAFGGRVARSPKGWGIGLQTYMLFEAAPWMDQPDDFAVPVSHQDQVIVQPPNSVRLAGSDFNGFGLLAYQDQPAISFQCHPEFDPEYAKALIETRRERLVDPDSAIESLSGPNDRMKVGGWIRNFLKAPA